MEKWKSQNGKFRIRLSSFLSYSNPESSKEKSKVIKSDVYSFQTTTKMLFWEKAVLHSPTYKHIFTSRLHKGFPENFKKVHRKASIMKSFVIKSGRYLKYIYLQLY